MAGQLNGNGRTAAPAVGVVVIGHGAVAAEMVHCLSGVVGTSLDGVMGLACGASEGPDELRRRVSAAVERVDRGAGVVVLTDMLGDTATNVSLEVARGRPGVEVVAGVNMPMLVKLATSRDGTTARGLADFLRRYGREHILWATEEDVSAELDGDGGDDRV